MVGSNGAGLIMMETINFMLLIVVIGLFFGADHMQHLRCIWLEKRIKEIGKKQ